MLFNANIPVVRIGWTIQHAHGTADGKSLITLKYYGIHLAALNLRSTHGADPLRLANGKAR
jgi:hypothetical protein